MGELTKRQKNAVVNESDKQIKKKCNLAEASELLVSMCKGLINATNSISINEDGIEIYYGEIQLKNIPPKKLASVLQSLKCINEFEV